MVNLINLVCGVHRVIECRSLFTSDSPTVSVHDTKATCNVQTFLIFTTIQDKTLTSGISENLNNLVHRVKGAFTCNEIQPDIPTNDFGPLFGLFNRLNWLQTHLLRNSIL